MWRRSRLPSAPVRGPARGAPFGWPAHPKPHDRCRVLVGLPDELAHVDVRLVVAKGVLHLARAAIDREVDSVGDEANGQRDIA